MAAVGAGVAAVANRGKLRQAVGRTPAQEAVVVSEAPPVITAADPAEEATLADPQVPHPDPAPGEQPTTS